MTKTTDMDIDQTESVTLNKLKQFVTILFNPSATHEEYEDALSSIQKVLASSDAFDILISPEIRTLYYEGLNPKVPKEVKNLTLNQLQRCAAHPKGIAVFEPKLVQLLIGTITTEDTGVAERTTQIFVKMGTTAEGVKILFDPANTSLFKSILSNKNETVKFRALDLFASVAGSSLPALQMCESAGYLKDIVGAFETDDVLQQLNVIELLDKLVALHEGAAYLEQTKTLARLASVLTSSDPLSSFMVPRAISFFGHLARRGDYEVSLLEKNNIPKGIKHALLEGNRESQEAAIAASGAIGSTPAGLLLLDKAGVFPEVLYFTTREDEIRIATFHSLSFLLVNIAKQELNSTVEATLSKIFLEVDTRKGPVTLVQLIMPLFSSPFAELRYSLFDVLVGLASHKFGLQDMMNYPGFYEFITNRSTESTKPGKEWKYSVIQAMVRTTAKYPNVVDIIRRKELEMYLRQGVFFVKSESIVEIAEETS